MSDMEDIEHDYVKVPDINGALAAKDQGNEFYKKKEYVKALEMYTKAHELHPTNAIYLGNRSAVYIAQENWTQALRDSKEATKVDKTYVKGYSREIKCNIALGNVAAARSSIENIRNNVKLDGDFDTIFKLELQQLKHLENAIQQAKNSEAKKEYRQASYYYKVASQAAVADKNLHINHIKNTALAGQVMDAHKMIFDVLQKNSNDANAILVRGICFHLEDNTEKALTHFSQALRLAPDLTEAKTYRMICKKIKEVKEKGNACFKEQNYTQAIEVYTEALTIDPPNRACNAKLLFNRALARSKIKETDPDKAEARDRLIKKDCDSAIEFDEKYVKAYRRRALVNQNLGEHDQAVRDFETVAKLEPTRENKQAVQQAKKQAKLAERKDYYKILKVSKDAEEKDLKKAYKKMALVHHPDRHSSASEEEKLKHEKAFKDVNEAFSVLSDPQKRHRYDNGMDLEGGGNPFGDGGIDPNLIFQSFFGGGMGGSPFGGMGGSRGGSSRGGGGHEFVFSFG